MPAERVIRVLEQLKESRPLPRQIRKRSAQHRFPADA